MRWYGYIVGQRDFQYDNNHSECIYFGEKHKVFAEAGLQREMLRRPSSFTPAGALTRQVTPQLAKAQTGTAESANDSTPSGNTMTNTSSKRFSRLASRPPRKRQTASSCGAYLSISQAASPPPTKSSSS